MSCPSPGPCKPNTCSRRPEVCVVDENNNTSCECPSCEGFPKELICARLDRNVQTYDNECELKKAACLNNTEDYAVLERRACKGKLNGCNNE